MQSIRMQTKSTLNSPVNCLPYVNPKVEKLLGKLGIKIIRDLLLYSPSRYLDFSKITKIKDLRQEETLPNFTGQNLGAQIFTVQGQIMSVANKRTWKRKINLTEAIIEDETGNIKAIWFNQPFIAHRLKQGQLANFSGKISAQNIRGNTPEIYFSNPAYEILGKNELAHTGRIVPLYPETAGLTSRWIRFLMKYALRYSDQMPEILPTDILKKRNFLPIKEAIQKLHFPSTLESAEKIKKQFAFREFLIIHLIVLNIRKKLKSQKAPTIKADIKLIKDFLAGLPFQLTNAQKKSAWQILKDMEKPNPMNRLLDGDVGSGKTIVAAIAALNAAKNNWQVAYLAPTEILARQHFETFCKFLQPFNLQIAFLTASENKIFDPELNQKYETKKNELAKAIEKNQINITIGTHALLQEKIKFSNLGLVIIDEQHRFGVNQRAVLLKNYESRITNYEKNNSSIQNSKFTSFTSDSHHSHRHTPQSSALIPHLLSMTATPIPRTLMLTIYGDLDISILNEMPKNRQKIITEIILPANRKKTYDFIRQEIQNGRQAFVVCPRIETQNQGSKINQQKLLIAEVKNAKEEYKKLSEEIFPDLKIAILHGKLKPKEKETTMKQFSNGAIDILVSTSVIEVGVDIPNATIMVIEGPERFGLAQLHQFRGRIGRDSHQSYCFLMTESENQAENERLAAIVKSENGFQLAEQDLQLRGPGEFLGTEQSGIPDMAFASFSDIFLIQETRDLAIKLLKEDPDLKKYPNLKDQINKSQEKIHPE